MSESSVNSAVLLRAVRPAKRQSSGEAVVHYSAKPPAQRTQAQQHIFERITNSLKGGVFFELDALLFVGDDAVSPLQRLKAPPGAPSPSAMEGLMDKLASIQETGILDIDLSWLNNNYQRALAAYVRKC